MHGLIIPDFSKSLILNSSDILTDYLELGIDSIFENVIVEKLPIAKTFFSVGETIKNIRERNLVKNLVVFINELNSGNIDINKLKTHQKELEDDLKIAEKELGRVLIILEQIIDNRKAAMLGKIYRSYINQEINWELFVEFSEIINRLFVNDLDVLFLIYDDKIHETSNREDMFKVERLNSLGIIALSMKSISVLNNIPRQDSNIILSSHGKLLCRIIFS